MNRPDKAGEPSMEEILASIRQIIADEPSTDETEPAIEANPLVPQSRGNPRPGAPLPLADRLSGVLKAGQLTPTSPLGSKRPLSFDQDLADMFDEEDAPNGNAVVAPKPDIRMPAGLSHPMATKPFVAQKQDSTTSAFDGAAALPPQFAPPETFVTPPFAGAGMAQAPVETVPEPPPAPKAFGFPPLRKASFYPPQPKVSPAAPAAQPDVAPSARAAEPMTAPPVTANEPATTPAHVADALKRLEGRGPESGGGSPAGLPEAPTEPTWSPLNGSAASTFSPAETPTFGVGADAARRDRADAPRGFVPSSTSFNASPAFEAGPASTQPVEAVQDYRGHEDSGAAPSFSASAPSQVYSAPPFGGIDTASFDAARAPTFGARPVEPRPIASPPVESRAAEPRSHPGSFAQGVRSSAGYGEPAAFAAQPSMSSAAAHSALDALAQGLAASAASSSGTPVSPAIPLTPVFEAPAPELRAAPSSSTLPAPLASPGSMPVTRTLEDAVADMLRPMLQQWVADNMPRIIERALRTEVAQSVKPGHKPPGT